MSSTLSRSASSVLLGMRCGGGGLPMEELEGFLEPAREG